MPPKRRIDKRRATIPLEVWAGTFETGDDFFDELADYGLEEPHRVAPDARAAAQALWIAALRDAWARLGSDYMRSWTPTDVRSVPWAMEVFGPPEDVKCR